MRRCCWRTLGSIPVDGRNVPVRHRQGRRPCRGPVQRRVFRHVLGLQLLAVVLLGPAMVAGTIATERERRTIEYLFASSLSNAEIVLGKLAAKLLHVVFMILAGVPVLALVMLLGGIAPEALLTLLILTLSTVLTVSAFQWPFRCGRPGHGKRSPARIWCSSRYW